MCSFDTFLTTFLKTFEKFTSMNNLKLINKTLFKISF